MPPDQVNQIAILLHSVEYDKKVAGQVRTLCRNDVQTWDEIMPEAGMYLQR